MKVCSAIATSLFVLFFVPTLAQGNATIEIDPGDSPLVITGHIGESNTFVGTLRLTAQGDDVALFTFLPSDLKHMAGAQQISRQHISLVGDPTLKANVPKDFQVSISGINKPGTYEGKLEILLPGQSRSEALIIALTVIAKARPVVTLLPGTDRIQLRLVNCGWTLNCTLARWLMPANAFLESWQLQLANEVQADVLVLNMAMVVLGVQTRYQLTETELILPKGQQTLPARQISTLPLTLHPAKIPPDHYTGAIYLRLDDRNEWLTIPVDLNVRVGPFWPLLALLLGITLGRLVKYMQERGRPQTEALAAVNKIALQVNRALPQDQQLLQPMLDEVRQLVYREKLETVETQLAAIESRLLTLQRLHDMETALQGKRQDPDAYVALQKIAKVRQCISRKEDPQAKSLIEEVQNTLEKLQTSLMSGSHDSDPDITAAQTQASEAVTAIDRAVQTLPVTPAETGWQRKLQDTLIFLSGLSDEIRAEATFWLMRPLLYLTLLLSLLAVGLSSLYVDKGLTFGTTPFTDYLGLVLWGLSTDIASRSLSNLPVRNAV